MTTQPRMTAMQLRNFRRRKREIEATKSIPSAETTVSIPQPTTSVLFSIANNTASEDGGAEVKGSRRPFPSYDPARGGRVVDDGSFQVKKLECGVKGDSIGGLDMHKPPQRRPAIEDITDFVLGEQAFHNGHQPQSTKNKHSSEINWIKNSASNLKLPLELCMRSKARFEAPQGSLKEINSFAPVHELAALQKIGGTVGNRRTTSLKGVEAAKSAFLAARMYWVYPATSLPAEALQYQSAALSNMLSDPSRAIQQFTCGAIHVSSLSGGWSTFFSTRRRDWEEAFRGLFCALRDGDPAEGEDLSFYLRCPGLSVVWCREERGEKDLVAVISRSNRALRERLRAIDAVFSLPLDDRPDRDDFEADNHHVKDFSVVGLKRGQYKYPQDPPSAPYKTLLRIYGSHNVYRLFDMFLEIGSGLNASTGGGLGQLAAISGVSSSKTLDVPLLLSRRPFMGATLRCLQTKLLPDKRQVESMNGKVKKTEDTKQQSESQHGGGGHIVSVLEVTGPVMPSALSEMATAATAGISSFMNSKHETNWQVLITPKMDHESTYLGFADHHALQDEFVCYVKGMNGSDLDSPTFHFGVQKHHIAIG